MNVFFIYEIDCECGYVTEGGSSTSMRVNKNSMVTTGSGIAFVPRNCKGCGKEFGNEVPIARQFLDDKSLEAVNVYRERKGWHPLRQPERTGGAL